MRTGLLKAATTLITAGLLLQAGTALAAAEPEPQPLGKLRPWKAGATPALSLQDAQGVIHNLAALKGKVVLVTFWATWCEPCRDEMPALAKLKRNLGESFEILSVNYGESQQKAEGFLRTVLSPSEGGAMTVLYDHDTGVARRWNARLLPASFIVGRNGRIAYTLVGEADWMDAGLLKAFRTLLTAKA